MRRDPSEAEERTRRDAAEAEERTSFAPPHSPTCVCARELSACVPYHAAGARSALPRFRRRGRLVCAFARPPARPALCACAFASPARRDLRYRPGAARQSSPSAFASSAPRTSRCAPCASRRSAPSARCLAASCSHVSVLFQVHPGASLLRVRVRWREATSTSHAARRRDAGAAARRSGACTGGTAAARRGRKRHGQTFSAKQLEALCSRSTLLEGPVFRVYRDTDRRFPPNTWRPCVLHHTIGGSCVPRLQGHGQTAAAT